jgi:ABC-2 type transport system ATP-binding protein
MDDAGIHPLDLGLKRPSLDDVFLSLTGHVAEDDSESDVKADSRSGKGRR